MTDMVETYIRNTNNISTLFRETMVERFEKKDEV